MILPSMRDEVLLSCGISSEIPPYLLSLEGSLTLWMQLKNFPDIPVSTRKEHRGSRHNSRRAPVFPSHPERRVHFPASSGKESLNSHRTSRGGSLNLKLERNYRSRVTISKDPDVPMHSRYSLLPCTDLTVTPRISSKHDGRFYSPVAPGDKATNPYVNSTGSLTLHFQLERKADLHVCTRDEV